ncbi:MAG: septal ring lytic transglycosylase RlpA family protein [Alphaproteobacteria bacterium]|nr:septal ring lytic transglycosylase RlpA family protein [Alphaproteobacteria bacterium]
MKKIVAALVLVAFALAGCSTVSEKTVGDNLCTGTKKPYQVKGNWYTPQEHYEYEETGIASWYGPHFHGRPKSCGEIFNMHGISAAHKTLPIPSVVRVTNVKNGTSVKLLIDDRGPFVDDRIIDLSKGAASYLGICQQGLGKVRVECLPSESKAFARFVSRYGRYGRDPNGNTWEAIFRQQFDRESGLRAPGPIRGMHTRAGQMKQRRQSIASQKRNVRLHRSPSVKSVSRRSRQDFSRETEREINELLNETRAKLKRKQI